MLEGYRLLPLLKVVGACLAVYLLKLAVVGVEARASHLLSHHVARERDDAYVVAWRRLNSHNVATLELKVVDILVVRAACIFEAHLENVGRDIVGILLQPVGLVELVATLRSYSIELIFAVAEAAATTQLGCMFFIATHRYNYYFACECLSTHTFTYIQFGVKIGKKYEIFIFRPQKFMLTPWAGCQTDKFFLSLLYEQFI